MSKIILDTEDFFQNDVYDDLMHIDHESYCCGEMFEKYETKITDLETKLAESEKLKESYRLQNEQHHLQLLQFYSRLGVEAFGADIHEKALGTLMIMKEELEEKNGVERALSACNRQNDEFSDMIKKLVNEKEELKQQLAIEELEKLKDFFLEPYKDEEMDTDYLITKDAGEIADYLLDQIKQLKEMK